MLTPHARLDLCILRRRELLLATWTPCASSLSPSDRECFLCLAREARTPRRTWSDGDAVRRRPRCHSLWRRKLPRRLLHGLRTTPQIRTPSLRRSFCTLRILLMVPH